MFYFNFIQIDITFMCYKTLKVLRILMIWGEKKTRLNIVLVYSPNSQILASFSFAVIWFDVKPRVVA